MVIFLSLSLIITNIHSKIANELTVHNNSNYNFIATSNARVSNNNIYKDYSDSLIGFQIYNPDNFLLQQSLNAEIYQEIEGVEYNNLSIFNEENILMGTRDLQENEIAISSNLANKHNLSINDEVYIRINNNVLTTKVVQVFVSETGVLNTSINAGRGIIVINSYQEVDVEPLYMLFSGHSNQIYSSIILKEQIVNTLNQNLLMLGIVLNLIFIAIIVLILVVTLKESKKRFVQLLITGETKFLNRYMAIDLFLTVNVPLLIIVLIQYLIFVQLSWIIMSISIICIMNIVLIRNVLTYLQSEVELYGE